MAEKTIVDYLNERGYKAFYLKPENGDNFVEGTAINIDGENIMGEDIQKTQYWNDYQKYLRRLKE